MSACALKGYIACCLWLTALALMLDGAMDGDGHTLPFGLFVGQVALGFTMWCMSVRRDHMRERSVEHIAEVVDALHDAKRSARHLR